MEINELSIILHNKKLLPIGLLNSFIQDNVLTKVVMLVKSKQLHRLFLCIIKLIIDLEMKVVEELLNMLGVVFKIDIEEMFTRIIVKISHYLD
jgi:hypothetical protein